MHVTVSSTVCSLLRSFLSCKEYVLIITQEYGNCACKSTDVWSITKYFACATNVQTHAQSTVVCGKKCGLHLNGFGWHFHYWVSIRRARERVRDSVRLSRSGHLRLIQWCNALSYTHAHKTKCTQTKSAWLPHQPIGAWQVTSLNDLSISRPFIKCLH